MLLLFLIVEQNWGHLSFRTSWESRIPGEEHMITCRLVTILGERYELTGEFRPLIGFVRPRKTSIQIIWDHVKASLDLN